RVPVGVLVRPQGPERADRPGLHRYFRTGGLREPDRPDHGRLGPGLGPTHRFCPDLAEADRFGVDLRGGQGLTLFPTGVLVEFRDLARAAVFGVEYGGTSKIVRGWIGLGRSGHPP